MHYYLTRCKLHSLFRVDVSNEDENNEMNMIKTKMR